MKLFIRTFVWLSLVIMIIGFFPSKTAHALAYPCDEAGLDAALTIGGLATFTCVGPTTITITSAKTVSVDGTILDGGNLLTISGNNGFRVFFVSAGVTATFQNLTITGGNAGAGAGGGIFNDGTLNLSNSTISGNIARFGGGIFNDGMVNLSNSTISGNTAANNGGGIYNNGTLNLSNSTVSGNTAASNGGGIRNDGTLNLSNSTISGNTAENAGGGIFTRVGDPLNIKGSIVSGNTAAFNPDCDNSGSFTTEGYNVFGQNGSNGGCPAGGLDIVPGAGVLIGNILDTTLALNGAPAGSPLTHALVAGSLALDAIAAGQCTVVSTSTAPAPNNAGAVVTIDERGVSRPQGTLCDIGAFELVVPDVTLSLAGSPFAENGGVATVTATLSAATIVDVTVNLGFTGIGTNGTDYNPSGTSILITAGNLANSINLTGINDFVAEGNETIVVDITSVVNGQESGTQQVTAEIIDDEIAPSPTPTLTPVPQAGVAVAQAVLSDTDFIIKTVDKALAQIGDTLTYTISFNNPKGNTLRNVVISDTFDSRLQNIRVISNTLGTASVSGNTVTVQGFELLPGQRVTLTIAATISNRAHPGDVIRNTATLESPDASIHVSNATETVILPGSLPATGERSRENYLIWLLPLILLTGTYLVRKRYAH